MANTLIDSDFQRFDSDFHYNDKFYQRFESISQYLEIHSQANCSAFKIVT
ncbi:hypothetical protein KNP414_03763 [Paenibacillus mucilaginosus KNP414]|uniref:Uncharacterized protein n=1 Tax=Paenibacillus mucilaginosus (strain KNP414) TaxID=1036673 RepID=F8FHJ4_PAEMK|nr:hypothetical protein KNP414_03763 [Paenibacillus mucilaginosus KNP414]